MTFIRTSALLLTVLTLINTPVNGHARDVTHVDWLNGFVSTKSSGYAKLTGSPVDADNAVEAARVVAQGNLLEAVKGVHVDRQTEIGELMEEHTQTSARVQGVLRNAYQVGEPTITEDKGFVIATVEMRVCLYDSKGCQTRTPLADALPKSSDTKKKGQFAAECDLLPNITDNRKVLQKGIATRTEPPEKIIINLKGMPFDSASRDLIIGFVADGGQRCPLYTPGKVEPGIRKDRGMAEILLHTPPSSGKNGADAFTVQATKVDSGNYLLVSRDDAYLISLFNDTAKNSIFSQARVAVALDD